MMTVSIPVGTKEVALNICDVKAFDEPVIITCHGIGSCVALYVYDRKTSISGGAHIMMPVDIHTEEMCNTCYAVEAISQLLLQMKKLGSDLKSLRSKMVGGANVINATTSIGKDNVSIVFNELVKRNIIVAAMDVGGNVSRTARFSSISKDVHVRSSHRSSYKLIL